jgi:hypothetical protein
MTLTAIELENFKAIGKRQRIELAPITLLFGANSSGKSTVLHALHYLREVIERRNLDPDRTLGGGGLDLGGFKSLVHGHDLKKAIGIRVEMMNPGYLIPNFSEMSLDGVYEATHGVSQIEDFDTLSFELSIQWSSKSNSPFVERFEIDIDNEPYATISAKELDRSSTGTVEREVSLFLNWVHPNLVPDDQDQFCELVNDTIWNLFPADYQEANSKKEISNKRIGEIFGTFLAMSCLGTPDKSDMTKGDPDRSTWRHRSLELQYWYHALPLIRTAVEPTISADVDSWLPEDFSREQFEKVISAVITPGITGVMALLCDHLDQTLHIGPLREIPPRRFQPVRSPDGARWASGLGAWDYLWLNAHEYQINFTNSWLSDTDKLNTGYEIRRTVAKLIEVPSPFSIVIERDEFDEEDLEILRADFLAATSEVRLMIWDLKNNIALDPSDIGTGISQVIPIIVGTVFQEEGLITIEQPELHIHPRMQVGIGDLIAWGIRQDSFNVDNEANKAGKIGDLCGLNFLIETHSEHIILRLLRRIRETAEDELPPGAPFLKSQDISVIYVESNDEGVQFHKIRVNKKGNFLDRWPSGFFEERGDELFP